VVFVENVKAGREVRVRRPHAAELAVARRVWIGDVSACDGDVPIHILRASLSERGIQAHKLDGRASDVLVADSLSQDAFDEIRVWREAVHPPPPMELPEWLKDTIKCNHKGEQR